MKWINKHVNSDFFNSYDEKYGNDDYWTWQKKMFEHPDILVGLKEIIRVATSTKNILNIGINNAFELEVLKGLSNYDWKWESVKITGIDLSISALKSAEIRLDNLGVKHKLINADITEIISFDGLFDICIAITSLQSAVIYDSNFKDSMNRIIGFMKPNALFLITAPNCSIENGKITSGGAYNVRHGKQDPSFAINFINECASILSQNGFSNTTMGNEFISLISQRQSKYI